MKIAAYLLATVNVLVWGFLAFLGMQTYRNYGHQITAHDAAIMVAVPVALLVAIITCMVVFRRRQSGLLLAAACGLTAVTAFGGLWVLGFTASGV